MNVTNVNSLPLLPASSRLVSLLNTLPITDYKRIITYLDGLALIRLSHCCRWLRVRISTDNALWQHIYYRQFLNNAILSKEWEFVEWCRRYTSNSNDNSQARQQHTLNWYDVYRRRLTTEMNWRHGRGRRTVIPLPEPDTYKRWSIGRTSDTGIILYGRSHEVYGSLSMNMVTVESAPFDSSNSSNGNGVAATSAILPTLKKLELSDRRDKDKSVIPLISERYVLIVVNCFHTTSSYMEIRDRGSLALRSICPLPYRSIIQAVRGRWAIFMYRGTSLGGAIPAGMVVWDLECGTVCPGSIDDIGNMISFHQVDEQSATVYVAKTMPDAGSTIIQWTRYQFFTQQPMRVLQQSSFRMKHPILNYVSSYPFDEERMVLKMIDIQKSYYIIHPVTRDTQGCHVLTRSVIVVVDADSIPTDTWYEHKLACITTEECKHVIGRMGVMSKPSDNNRVNTLLMDMDSGREIRGCLSNVGLNDYVFLMTSIMRLVSGRNELEIIDYGAL